MVTQATDIEYLLSTPRNYTCTHLADHLTDISHDQVNRFLRTRHLSARQLQWASYLHQLLAKPPIPALLPTSA